MAGLLNGALMGLGQGVSEAGNFLLRAKADEIKEARLQKYEREREQRQNQRQDAIRAEDRQWQQEDYQTQRSHAVEDRDVGYQHQVGLLQMREAGANQRAGMQINAANQRAQWGLLTQGMDAEGNPVMFNPISGEQYSAPPGVTLVSDGKLTPVQERRLDSIQSEKEALRATFEDGMGGYRQPTKQEAEYLQALQTEENEILRSQGGSAGGGMPTPFEVLMAGEVGGDTGEPAPGASGGGNPPPAGGSAPPPRPGQPAPASSTQESPENFSGLINQAMADQRQQQANRQSAAEQRQIESQINTIRGLAARAGRGPGMSQADRDSLGRQAVEQAEALMQQGNLTAEQVQRLRSAAEDVVRFTELDFN